MELLIANFAQFAAEAIGAFRTVTSLTLEDMICDRYDALLEEHLKKAFDKGKLSTTVFALSDSIPLACMAMTFYYGGTLLASHEYTAINFFVVYMAVINGAQSAGAFLGFGPSKSTSIVGIIAWFFQMSHSSLQAFLLESIKITNMLISDFAQAAQAANRILSFRVPDKQDNKATAELQDTEGGVKIELRDLWFKYPTRDVPIFTGLNLTVSDP